MGVPHFYSNLEVFRRFDGISVSISSLVCRVCRGTSLRPFFAKRARSFSNLLIAFLFNGRSFDANDNEDSLCSSSILDFLVSRLLSFRSSSFFCCACSRRRFVSCRFLAFLWLFFLAISRYIYTGRGKREAI